MSTRLGRLAAAGILAGAAFSLQACVAYPGYPDLGPGYAYAVPGDAPVADFYASNYYEPGYIYNYPYYAYGSGAAVFGAPLWAGGYWYHNRDWRDRGGWRGNGSSSGRAAGSSGAWVPTGQGAQAAAPSSSGGGGGWRPVGGQSAPQASAPSGGGSGWRPR